MNLPDELFLQIFSYLDYRTLLDLKSVSKLFLPNKVIRDRFRKEKAKRFDIKLNTFNVLDYLNNKYENDDLHIGDVVRVEGYSFTYIYDGRIFEVVETSFLPDKFRIFDNGLPKDYWTRIKSSINDISINFSPNLNLSLIADQIKSKENVKLIDTGLNAIVPVTIYGQKYYIELPTSRLKTLAGVVNVGVGQNVIKIF